MKKQGIIASFFLISLFGIGCVQTDPTLINDYEYPPSFVNIVQEQEIPDVEKQTDRKPIPVISTETLRYSGTWFDIDYPSSFKPSPNEIKGTDPVATDEATFTSSDESVQFYVYSPLWSGQSEYLTVKNSEDLVDRREVETPGTGFDKALTEWTTVRAKDGSYFRSYVHFRKQIDTGSEYTYTFGIKYKDANAYNTYKDAYIAFKKSLVQYAD